MNKERNYINEKEIDLVLSMRFIWEKRKLVVKVSIVFLILGIIYAYGSKVQYTASCKLMPESQEGSTPNLGGLGGLGGLAGLAGINFDLNTNTLSPELYPQIVNSLPFQLKIVNEPLYFQKYDTVASSYDFLTKIDNPSIISILVKYTFGLPFEIKSWLSSDYKGKRSNNIENDQIIRISNRDDKFIEKFRDRIMVYVDQKTGIITLESKMPDPIAAAQITEKSLEFLTQYVIDYRVKKARENLDFIEQSYFDAKQNFEIAQKELAIFNDRNRNVTTSLAQIEQEKLKNEFNLTFDVYKSLANQYEQAKIEVKEVTPVFTLLEPIKIPNQKSEPRRILILIISLFIGILFGAISPFIINTYSRIINKKFE